MASGQKLIFPLIRHLSGRVTPLLLMTPISANGVSVLSLISGVAAGWFLMAGSYASILQAAGLLLVSYILDNCDGEVARARGQASAFGEALDDFADWIVHAVFFFGLGYGHAEFSGENVWFWLGNIAAVGATINYSIGQYLTFLERRREEQEEVEEEDTLPTTSLLWVIYFLRELSRADFCFLVLLLALLGGLWVLLPAGAIGAQIYWMTQFVRGARKFHV